ncbi:MAG: hypothetical protein ACTHM0_15760 [Sphingomonas sp.]
MHVIRLGKHKKEGRDMRLLKFTLAGAIAVSTLATSAIAAPPTGSTGARPSAQHAPVTGLRSATPIRHASSQSDEGSPVLGYALEGVVAAGLVAATIVALDDDSNSHPASPG